MITFWNLITALPALIRLLQTLQKKIDEAGVDRKVHTDVRIISEAFEEMDAAKLTALFSNK